LLIYNITVSNGRQFKTERQQPLKKQRGGREKMKKALGIIFTIFLAAILATGCATINKKADQGTVQPNILPAVKASTAIAGPSGNTTTTKDAVKTAKTATTVQATSAVVDDGTIDYYYKETPEKPANHLAGKLNWNTGEGRWVRQICLYNGADKSMITNNMGKYVLALKAPARSGSKPWENYGYKDFYPGWEASAQDVLGKTTTVSTEQQYVFKETAATLVKTDAAPLAVAATEPCNKDLETRIEALENAKPCAKTATIKKKARGKQTRAALNAAENLPCKTAAPVVAAPAPAK
jgi:hypothetical protein